MNKVACTSKICEWNAARKRAYPAPLKNLDFKRPNKKETVPRMDSHFTGTLKGYSTPDPINFITQEDREDLEALKKIAPDAAVFNSISLWDDSSEEGSTTDTADETETNTLPELLTSFFDPSTINNTHAEVTELGEKLYNEYLKNCTQLQFDNLTKTTTQQSLNHKWMLHRAGRITASNCKCAFAMDVKSPALSTIKQIMQYGCHIDTPATKYGKEMETTARDSYFNENTSKHDNLTITSTGLHINQKYPFLGASPDGILNCSCHGKGLLEIKCPFKYKDGLKHWIDDKNCPITAAKKMKINHPYYFQVQLQMLVTELRYCDFFVWSNGTSPGDTFQVRVCINEEFCFKLKEKLESVFHVVILPELVCRKFDEKNEKEQELYCYCKRPSFPPMVGCDGRQCKIEWFHYSCVGLSRTPSEKVKWFCPDCKKKS